MNNSSEGSPVNVNSFGSIPYFVLCFLQSIFIVVGNSFVIAAVIRFKRLRTVTNVFVCSLALADVCIGLIGCISTTVFVLRYDGFLVTFDLRYDVWISALNFLLFSASFLHLLAVSLERYLAILHPFWHMDKVTEKRCVIVTLVIWFCTSLWSGAYLISGTIAYNTTADFQEVSRISMWTNASMISITMILICILYHRIRNTVLRHIRRIQGEFPSATCTLDNRRRVETKKSKIIFVILFGFIVCYVPVLVIGCVDRLVYSTRGKPPWFQTLTEISYLFVFTNSFINPIVYGGMNSDFRSSFKKMISCTAFDGRSTP